MSSERPELSSEIFLLQSIRVLEGRLIAKYRTPQPPTEAQMDAVTLIGLKLLSNQVSLHSPFADPEDIAIERGRTTIYRMLIAQAQRKNWDPIKNYLLREAAEEAQESTWYAKPDDYMESSRLLFKIANSL